MNKRKSYGRKIKHKKTNLYRRKKTKAQKIFGTVILIIIIAAVAFVGYCLGRPVLDYLGRGEEKTPAWTPQSSFEQQPVPETEASEETTAPAPDAPPAEDEQPALPSELAACNLPSGALANKAALSAALVKAKSAGYTSASVQLKDEAGYFHYASEMEELDSAGLIKGSMTAGEIVETFLENNMIPSARISVLKDSEGTKHFNNMSYKCYSDNVSWLDYSSGTPTLWADPSAPASREYITAIAAELKNAGFMNIILENVIYPDFQHYDKSYILQKYYDKSRYQYLYNVIPDGTIVEMRASDIVGEEFGRTAEPLYDTASLSRCKIAVVISRKDFPVSEGNPADAASLAEIVMSAVSKRTGSLTVIPVFDPDFTSAEAASAAQALRKLGYDGYIVK